MDSLLTRAFYLTSIPTVVILIIYYKSGQYRWSRLLISVLLILFGAMGVYAVCWYASVPKFGVAAGARDYLIFGHGLIASLGIGGLLVALDYSAKREEVIQQFVARYEKRERRKRENLQMEIYRGEAEYQRRRALDAFDPGI